MTPTDYRNIKIKRAYDPSDADDGYRVYIDRLWPRGLSHATFHYDSWDKAIAPSSELREWFHEDPDGRWDQFRKKYIEELRANPAFSDMKKEIACKTVVTLLFSSHDREHNNAVVVREALLSEL
ncbi:MAG: DUF488 family protein [Barnesiella sp.]|nr:DUF488 family protein [Barnesiella sp.]